MKRKQNKKKKKGEMNGQNIFLFDSKNGLMTSKCNFLHESTSCGRMIWIN